MSNPQSTETPRRDNLFGVCAALGEDFGFNPLWLRIALAVSFLFRPELTVSGYFAIGLVVLITRLIYPNTKSKPESAATARAIETVEFEEPLELARAA